MLELINVDLLIQVVQAVIIVASAFSLLKILNRLLTRIIEATNEDRKRVINNVKRFLQIVIYSVALVLVLWIFKVDVTGLLAGLGIGALVIGFALKDIIENWVSGLLIFTGKTYKIGDVIQVGTLKGVVTGISLRTTVLKTYDRNEIIMPNSLLLKEKIINLTGGGKEMVSSVVFSIDYIFNVEKAKTIIEAMICGHPNVVVDKKRKREIRFIVRCKEWATELEVLFWINAPENEEFIKSRISELVKKKLAEEKILPPIPAVMRKDFMEKHD
ncbi:mechanosensitive ion channel family protein [Candidatus Bathyarchaeota archaeon]|nr:mechanosensitive ion channel family protein [Candidatus Bathyarchaeota archaeon]